MVRLIPIWRVWWLVLDAARMATRTAAEYRPRWHGWPAAMTARYLCHYMAASPWLAAWALVVVWVGPSQTVLKNGLIACAIAELVALAARFVGWIPGANGFWTFRRAIALHRRLPRIWGDYAGRTGLVQAHTGAEPSTSIRWRPLVDHPRLTWAHLITAPDTVEYLVGPPPDRTYADLIAACPAIAARLPFVDAITVDYDTNRSSIAVLTVTFTPTRSTPTNRPALTTTNNRKVTA